MQPSKSAAFVFVARGVLATLSRSNRLPVVTAETGQKLKEDE